MAQKTHAVQWLVLVLVVLAGAIVVYAVNSLATPYRVSAETPTGPAIHDAAALGDATAVKRELGRGVAVDTKLEGGEAGKAGMTPLMAAAMAGKPEVIKVLLDAKARTEARATDGRTALFFAAGWGGPAATKALLDAGALVDARIEGAWTPLMIASARGDVATVQALLKAGADVNAVTSKARQTPLMLAAIAGDVEKVSLLLGAGALIGATDKDGNTALSKAAESEVAPPVLQELIRAGSKVEQADSDGVTPLMKAALRGDANQVKVLLAGGANKAVKDSRGWDALQFANTRGDEKGQAVEALLR